MRRTADKCFRFLPVLVLLVAHGLADTRKPVANPDPEYPEIARRMNIIGTVRMEIVIAAEIQCGGSKFVLCPSGTTDRCV